MAQELWSLKEDGYLNVDLDSQSIVYHPTLNIILVITRSGYVHVLDVNSGVVLQTSSLCAKSNSVVKCQYLEEQNKVLFLDGQALGVRSDYNGVLLLDTILQRRLKSSDETVKLELLLSEAVIFQQSLKTIDLASSDLNSEVLTELTEKINRAQNQPKTGIKAQKWNTICLELRLSTLRGVAHRIVSELKRQGRHVPALAVAAAIVERLAELGPREWTVGATTDRAAMHSEARRRETFARWPHMDYKWALPEQMAQAGFYHQPNSSGDDRAMCFTCAVCLVCWERTDEPWSEHERHSPSCPFVKGEYTQNVPLSVTYATSPALEVAHGAIIAHSNVGDLAALGHSSGMVTVHNIVGKAKRTHCFYVTHADHYIPELKHNVLRRENHVTLTALSIVGERKSMSTPQPHRTPTKSVSASPQKDEIRIRPAVICGITVSTRDNLGYQTDVPYEKLDPPPSVKALNDHNQQKNESTPDIMEIEKYNDDDDNDDQLKKYLYLVVYDFLYKSAACERVEDPKDLSYARDDAKALDIEEIVDGLTSSNPDKSETFIKKCSEILMLGKLYVDSEDALDEPSETASNVVESVAAETSEPANVTWEVSPTSYKNFIPPENDKIFIPSEKPAEPHDGPRSFTEEDGLLDTMYQIDKGVEYSFVDRHSDGVDRNDDPFNEPGTSSDKSISDHITDLKSRTDARTISYSHAVQCVVLPDCCQDRNLQICEIIPTKDGKHVLVVLRPTELDIMATSVLLVYDLNFSSRVVKIKEKPSLIKELAGAEQPEEVSVLPVPDGLESSGALAGLAAVVCVDGAVRLIDLATLDVVSEAKVDGARYVSATYCNSLERLCVCTERGPLHFYAISGRDSDFVEERDEEDYGIALDRANGATSPLLRNASAGSSLSEEHNQTHVADQAPHSSIIEDSYATIFSDILAGQRAFTVPELRLLHSLCQFEPRSVAYCAVLPPCWTEMQQCQRKETGSPFTRTWRLQTDATTWDEHVLELTLPWAECVGHVDLRFSLHAPCPSLPNIQVTLLKQHASGIGFRKFPMPSEPPQSPAVDEPVSFPLLDGLRSNCARASGLVQNLVLTDEYLRAHNADILAGPVGLSSCLDLSEHGGCVTLTSPKLLRARGRTMLIHIKALLDISKGLADANSKAGNNPKKCRIPELNFSGITSISTGSTASNSNGTVAGSGFENFLTNRKTECYIGCDWLHEISISVRQMSCVNYPNERSQRVTMVESNSLLDMLCVTVRSATENGGLLAQALALEILEWIATVRLGRRGSELGASLLRTLEPHLYDLIKTVLVGGTRSLAHKLTKLLIVCVEGGRNMASAAASQQFDSVLLQALLRATDILGAIRSASALRWFALLLQHVANAAPYGAAAVGCLALLRRAAEEFRTRTNVYHQLLRSRFGLYGTPFDPNLFDVEPPQLLKSTSVPVTFASVVAGDLFAHGQSGNGSTTSFNGTDNFDPKDLFSIPGISMSNQANQDPKQVISRCRNLIVNNHVRGLLETEPLHYACVSASDGTKLERYEMSGTDVSPVIAPMIPTAIPPTVHHYFTLVTSANPSDQCPVFDNPESRESAQDEKAQDGDTPGVPSDEMIYLSMDSDTSDSPVQVSVIKAGSWNTAEQIVSSAAVDEKDAQKANGAQTEHGREEDKKTPANYEIPNGNCSQLPWQQLLIPPPHQMLVIERMHSGARRFVVLDFGAPVLLTDLLIPASADLVSLNVDVWWHNEDVDCVRLATASDIGTKCLVLTDLQPAPLCRFMKITIIGRYGMSTTRCKIPIGHFYGHIIVLPEDTYGNVETEAAVPTRAYAETQLSALSVLLEDIECRYTMASSRLRNLLDPLLAAPTDSPSAHYTNAYLRTAKETKDFGESPCAKSVGAENAQIVAAYQKCTTYQHQLNLIRNVVGRLETHAGRPATRAPDESRRLTEASTDKLRSICESFLGVLINAVYEVGASPRVDSSLFKLLDRATCEELFAALCVGNDSRLQLSVASLLVRMCGLQPWWGEFLSDSVSRLYASDHTAIFPQERLFVILAYLGRKSLSNGASRSAVLDPVLRGLCAQLRPLADVAESRGRLVAAKADLGLLGWSLLFLSFCLDAPKLEPPADESRSAASRWDWLVAEAAVDRAAANRGGTADGYRRKLHKRFLHYKQQLDHLDLTQKAMQASTQALSALSNHAANLSTKLEVVLKQQEHFFKKIKQFKTKQIEDMKSKRHEHDGGKRGETSPRREPNASGGDAAARSLDHAHCLVVARGLIALILNMDCTCNVDLFLLSCKTIARLITTARPVLSLRQLVTPSQSADLLRLAVRSESSPWVSHAIACLLQDMLEGHRAATAQSPEPSPDDAIYEGASEVDADDATDPKWSAATLDGQSAASVNGIIVLGDMLGVDENDGDLNTMSSKSNGVPLPSLPESDDSELDDVLDDILERGRHLLRKTSATKSGILPTSSYSTAIDARLDVGLDGTSEIILRRLTTLGSCYLPVAVNASPSSPLDVATDPSTLEPWPAELLAPWTDLAQSSELGNVTILTRCFDALFAELEFAASGSILEQTLQLWITLSVNLSDTVGRSNGNGSFAMNPFTVPGLTLSPASISHLLSALTWQSSVSLRAWTLAFQCLTLAANLPYPEQSTHADGGVGGFRVENDIERSLNGMAGYIVKDAKFPQMLLRFFSGNSVSLSEKRFAGPSVCQALHELIVRLQIRADVVTVGSRLGCSLKDTLLRTLQQLLQQGTGPLTTPARGPLDAHCKFVQSLLSLNFVDADLDVAMSVIESIGVLVYGYMSQVESVKCVSLAEQGSSQTSCFGSLFSSVLGTDASKHGKPVTYDNLIISLLKLSTKLIQTPLPSHRRGGAANGTSDAQSNGAVFPTSQTSPQTDGSGAERQDRAPNASDVDRAPVRVSCVADNVLQHVPTVLRLCRTLSTCSGSSLAMLVGAMPHHCTVSEIGEPGSVADAVFQLLAALAAKASHVQLLLKPILEFLSADGPFDRNVSQWTLNKNTVQLSEPLVWWLLQVLSTETALREFTTQGGVRLLAEHLVRCQRAALTTLQPAAISQVMQHLSTGNNAQAAGLAYQGGTTNSKKTQQANIENNEALVNFAPLGVITSTSPTAQPADVLIQASVAPHRRARTPQWSYHFYPDESHVELCISLPAAVLLREVQLQPHLNSLATCPSAITLEVSRTGPSGFVPLCSPLPTSGMSFIRLHLPTPEVVTNVLIRLYKPRDSTNIGLLQIRLLGTAAFGGNNNKTSVNDLCDEERLTKSSLGWLRLLHQCFDLPAAESELGAVVVGEAAQVPGLLEACCGLVLVPTQIPPLFVPNLERVLLKLSLLEPELSLRTMRTLLNNGAALVQSTREPNDRTVESVCELLFKLCTTRDPHTERRVRAAVDWLHGAARSAVSRENAVVPPSSSYVQCVASVLWSMNRADASEKLKSYVTRDFFECVLAWTTIAADRIVLKRALDAVLCSSCAIDGGFFTLLLEKTGVLAPSPETPSRLVVRDARDLFLDRSQLETIATAARSPPVAEQLLGSGLPRLLAAPLADFFAECYEMSGGASSCVKLDDLMTRERDGRPMVRMGSVVNVLDFFSDCCAENAMRQWLGSTQGSAFWIPLMKLLCRGRSSTSNGLRSDELRGLEDATVRFVSRCCSLCPSNQTLLAVCLCEVIESDASPCRSAGISGFVRRLVLQFLLENEKVWIHVKANEAIYACSRSAPDTFGPHPAYRITDRHVLLRLDTCTTLGEILDRHVSYTATFGAQKESPDAVSSPTVKYLKRDMWEVALDMTDQMSVAAGVTAKDKRAKDAKNLALCSSTGAGQPSASGAKKKDAGASDSSAPCCENSTSAKCNRSLRCDQLPHVALPPSTKLANILAKLNTQILEFTIVPSNDGGVGMTDAQVEAEFGRLKSPLEVFSMWEGLEILAQHLPLVYTETSRSVVGLSATSGPVPATGDSSEQDWVKVSAVEGSEDIYEDLEEAGTGTGTGGAVSRGSQATTSVPPHSLAAFGLFLRLPWYAEMLLRDYKKAQCLLRLVLGVTDDGEGGDIFASPVAGSLPTLPFQVLKRLYDAIPITTDDSRLLRCKSIEYGVVRLLLSCLSVFTHQSSEMVPHASVAMLGSTSAQPTNGAAPSKTTDDKSHLYWAKGTGFGTGSTHQSWNVEQALLRQRSEEEHVTVLLQVLSSYINPTGTGDVDGAIYDAKGGGVQQEVNDATDSLLPPSFYELLQQSCLLPALCSYLRNDSVLDMARHIPLYRAVLQLLRAVAMRPQLVSLLLPQVMEQRSNGSMGAESCAAGALSVVSLLANMKLCVDTYASRLKINKKPCSSPTAIKTTKFKFMSTDESESDEGLALLIPDIQTTADLVRAAVAQRCSRLDEDANTSSGTGGGRDVSSYGGFDGMSKPLKQSLEHRYMEVMKRLQFDTFEMIRECTETEGGGYQFVVSYHFENNVRTAGDRSHPARVKRLAQEAVTLATSLPLSYSSSVFVRCDTDRLDVMKVLITGPADTPYANGCFELDVYFPPDYPQAPMMINLETTGRHTVRFNPNLYNDGKVCLSVLNTWHGRPEEKWNAHTSSFLQVLVSIQSLILVPEPYFNEPGYERSRGSPSGTQSSLEYNANICQATVRWAMLEQIRNPCPCFKQVIHTHFWLKRHEVAAQIERWIAELESQSPEKRTNNRTSSKRVQAANALALKHHYFQLHEELSRLKTPDGLEDLEEVSAMHSLPPLLSLPFNATSTPIAETFPSVVIPVSDTPNPTADPSAAADVHHDIDTDIEMEKMVSKVCE